MKKRITKVSSFRSQLHYEVLQTGGFCASRDGDEVFLCGERGSGGSRVLQRYNRAGQLLNTWQDKCGHDINKHLLHLSIDNTPYIAMTCLCCKSIRLYSMTDNDPITAYCDIGVDQVGPAAMCHGPGNTILVSNWSGGDYEVLMYDVTSTQFTLKDRIPVDADQAFHIHYMDTAQHGGIVIVSNPYDKIMMVYNTSKDPIWKIENKEIDEKMLWPNGICSDPDTGALYVGDFEDERLIVIQANGGEVLESIQLPGVEEIRNIAWCSVKPHLVIHHRKDGMNQITYCDIS